MELKILYILATLCTIALFLAIACLVVSLRWELKERRKNKCKNFTTN